jgi:hypothetical protein
MLKGAVTPPLETPFPGKRPQPAKARAKRRRKTAEQPKTALRIMISTIKDCPLMALLVQLVVQSADALSAMSWPQQHNPK